jgi:ABC-type glycerol-3-phosphate transport system substrate-binding protein
MKNLSLFQIGLLASALFIAGAGLVTFILMEGSSDQATSLVIWTDFESGPTTEYLQTSSSETAEVSVEVFDSANFVSEVISELSLGKSPDILITTSANQAGLGARLKTIPFESLPESQFKQTYISGAQDAFRTNEGYFGIPLAVDPLIIYSNSNLMDAYGITAVPEFWSEMSRVVNSFAQRSGNVVNRVIIPLGLSDNVVASEDIFASLLGQVGTTPLQQTEYGYVSELSSSPQAQQILNYYTDFANPNSGVYNWNANYRSSRDTFSSEDSVFYIDFATQYSDLIELNPNMDINVSKLPQIKSNQPFVIADYYGFYFPQGSDQTADSVEYAAGLASDKDFINLLNSQNLISTARSQINVSDNNPVLAAASQSALYSSTWPKPSSKTIDLFSELIADVLYRGVGTSEALSNYATSLTQL